MDTDVQNATCSQSEVMTAPEAPPVPEIKISGSGYMPTPKPTFEPLRMHFAVNNGDIYDAKRQLSRGISLEYVTQGCTPLILAIIKEQTEIALLLIKGGADVNHAEETKQARLPIHVAAKYGSLEIMEALIEHGASVHSIDNDSMTALHVASYEGHIEVVKYLVSIGAHLNCRDGRGRSSLFNAIERNNLDTVSFLISVGAIVNCVDKIGWTPLIECVVCGYVDLVRLLLRHGADVKYPDRNGNTPLHHACARLSNTQKLCLIQTNIDYNMRHLSTLTPVATRAIRHIYSHIYDIIYALVDYGADVNARNIDDETSLNIAVDTEKHQVIPLLISAGAEFPCPEPWLPRGMFLLPHLAHITHCLQELAVPNAKPLTSLCKLAIRKNLKREIGVKIKTLPLPESVKQFIHLTNENEMSS